MSSGRRAKEIHIEESAVVVAAEIYSVMRALQWYSGVSFGW